VEKPNRRSCIELLEPNKRKGEIYKKVVKRQNPSWFSHWIIINNAEGGCSNSWKYGARFKKLNIWY